MLTLVKDGWFEASHWIEGHPKCGVLHGHSYKVVIKVTTYIDDKDMVLDFGELSNLIKYFDHKCLNELAEFKGKLTTAENIVLVMKEKVLELWKAKWGNEGCKIEISMEETRGNRIDGYWEIGGWRNEISKISWW